MGRGVRGYGGTELRRDGVTEGRVIRNAHRINLNTIFENQISF